MRGKQRDKIQEYISNLLQIHEFMKLLLHLVSSSVKSLTTFEY